MKPLSVTSLTNSINRSPLRCGLFLIGLALALSAMTETAHGQTPTPTPTLQGGDLFATVNLGGTLNNGASPIYRYTPDGSSSIFASALDTPRGLAFDGAGNLYVATNTNLDPSLEFPPVQGTILKITPGGFMSTFATGFPVSFLQGLATDSDRNVFVTAQVDATTNAPSTIYKITPDGTLSSFASLSATGWALAFDGAGNLYAAATDSNGNGEILRFAPDGTPDSSPFVGPTDFPNTGPFPIGLAFDTSGNLFASTINGNDSTGDIRKFGPGGTEITPRFATGLTKGPRGLAFDGAGNLFVAEIGIPGSDITGDILEFTPGGTESVFSSQGFGFRGNRGPEWLAFTTGAVTAPSSAVTLTFPGATEPLTTTVTSVDYNSVPLPPSNFELETGSNLAFEITATTEPTPPIIIAFTVPESVYSPTLKALHYENGNWVDSTIYPTDPNYPSNPAPNTVYASVNSLSPFLVAKFRYAAQVQQPINANGTSVFNVRRGVIPVKFTLTDDGSSTCTLPPATIAVTRTAGGTTGAVNESVYSGSADNGSNFRIVSCQYVYNLNSNALGVGTYRVDAKVNGTVVGSGVFQLK